MSGRGADSFFEEAVQAVLAKHGFQVDNQVGVAGFFIDLAVVDPDAPGRYLLGIECDGAAYHSAPSARDRDRLRQEILEAHGWPIHRIWSTDWFQRGSHETDRLLNAIAGAKASRRSPPPVAIFGTCGGRDRSGSGQQRRCGCQWTESAVFASLL
jgi:very-short-patch-repair endonuclease